MDQPSEPIQQSLHVSISLLTQITQLNFTIDKFRYSILAHEYDDSLKLARECQHYFQRFASELKRHYLQSLHQKYLQCIDLLKTQLLQDFSPEHLAPNYLDRAGEILSLLSEHERIKFLQALCEKIGKDIPPGPFIQNYRKQLFWIRPFLDPESRYRVLDQWARPFSFHRFIIDEWAGKIRDNILSEDIKQITLKMFLAVTTMELKIRNFHPNPNGLLTITFDPFCQDQILNLFETYHRSNHAEPYILSETTNGVYDSISVRFFQLSRIEQQCRDNCLLSERNVNLLARILEPILLEIITNFSSLITEDYLTNLTNLQPLKSTLAYLKTNLDILTTRYDISPTAFQSNLEKLNHRIYQYYQRSIKSYLPLSIRSYRNRLLDTLRDTILKSEIPESEAITLIINLLPAIKEFDPNLCIYLLADIQRYYQSLIDIASLNNNEIKPDIFPQLLMDIYQIKECVGDKSRIFEDVESKIKFLNGTILDEKSFVEQYKIFYNNHSFDMLKAILKFKGYRSATIYRHY